MGKKKGKKNKVVSDDLLDTASAAKKNKDGKGKKGKKKGKKQDVASVASKPNISPAMAAALEARMASGAPAPESQTQATAQKDYQLHVRPITSSAYPYGSTYDENSFDIEEPVASQPSMRAGAVSQVQPIQPSPSNAGYKPVPMPAASSAPSTVPAPISSTTAPDITFTQSGQDAQGQSNYVTPLMYAQRTGIPMTGAADASSSEPIRFTPPSSNAAAYGTGAVGSAPQQQYAGTQTANSQYAGAQATGSQYVGAQVMGSKYAGTQATGSQYANSYQPASQQVQGTGVSQPAAAQQQFGAAQGTRQGAYQQQSAPASQGAVGQGMPYRQYEAQSQGMPGGQGNAAPAAKQAGAATSAAAVQPSTAEQAVRSDMQAAGKQRKRHRLVIVILVIVLAALLGVAGYLYRDQITGLFANKSESTETAATQDSTSQTDESTTDSSLPSETTTMVYTFGKAVNEDGVLTFKFNEAQWLDSVSTADLPTDASTLDVTQNAATETGTSAASTTLGTGSSTSSSNSMVLGTSTSSGPFLPDEDGYTYLVISGVLANCSAQSINLQNSIVSFEFGDGSSYTGTIVASGISSFDFEDYEISTQDTLAAIMYVSVPDAAVAKFDYCDATLAYNDLRHPVYQVDSCKYLYILSLLPEDVVDNTANQLASSSSEAAGSIAENTEAMTSTSVTAESSTQSA